MSHTLVTLLCQTKGLVTSMMQHYSFCTPVAPKVQLLCWDSGSLAWSYTTYKALHHFAAGSVHHVRCQ